MLNCEVRLGTMKPSELSERGSRVVLRESPARKRSQNRQGKQLLASCRSETSIALNKKNPFIMQLTRVEVGEGRRTPLEREGQRKNEIKVELCTFANVLEYVAQVSSLLTIFERRVELDI